MHAWTFKASPDEIGGLLRIQLKITEVWATLVGSDGEKLHSNCHPFWQDDAASAETAADLASVVKPKLAPLAVQIAENAHLVKRIQKAVSEANIHGLVSKQLKDTLLVTHSFSLHCADLEQCYLAMSTSRDAGLKLWRKLAKANASKEFEKGSPSNLFLELLSKVQCLLGDS